MTDNPNSPQPAPRSRSPLPPSSSVDTPDDSGDAAFVPDDAIVLVEPPKTVRGLELFAVLLMVVLADLTIYRGGGFAGWAVLTISAPLLLMLGTRKFPRTALAWVLGLLLGVVALKLLWLGTELLAVAASLLIAALAMELAGITPFVFFVPIFVIHLIAAGFRRFEDYAERSKHSKWAIPRERFLQVAIPLGVVLGFSTIFIMANPDVARTAGEMLTRFVEAFERAVSRFAPTWGEAVFWLATGVLFAGMLKPLMAKSDADTTEKTAAQESPAPLYAALANTLVAVIGLFVFYLAFEFHTLWFREFPEGFHYSGYAHEGAAWLTVALALATLLLSAIFRGDVMQDPRLPKLRKLAWIWSALNLVLAVAVYHRLLIYVEFNGMTRMRTIGFLGISSVVLGFLLVIRKITAGESFLWLIHRQSWVLALALILYLVLPVDALVHRYNVCRILGGDPAPSVQISVHPIDAGGVIELAPLLDADDTIIREGVRALFAERSRALRKKLEAHENWSDYQRAEEVLQQKFNGTADKWAAHKDPGVRQSAWSTFQDYAYQWY